MPLKTTAGNHGEAAKGRGSPINPEGRFEKVRRDAEDDGWFQEAPEGPAKPKTVVTIERVKTIITRNDSPDIGFDRSINPYRGCEHGCSYCLHGDTPILMANGRTRPVSELKIGEELYGTRRYGFYHRYARSRVLAHWSVVKPAFRTTLQDGTVLVTSGDHRFLTERGWKHVTGAEQGAHRRPFLTTNNKLMGTGAFAESVRENEDYRLGYLCGMIRGDGHLSQREYRRSRGKVARLSAFRLALCDEEALLRSQDYLLDLGVPTQEGLFQAGAGSHRAMYAIRSGMASKIEVIRGMIEWPTNPTAEWFGGFLAGIFDAEGHFSQTVLRISNSDGEIINRTIEALDHFGFDVVVEDKRVPEGRKPMRTVRVLGGLREQLRFFHTVRPAITRKLSLDGQAIKGDAQLGVVSIEPLGRAMRLFDITTETEDFIANGVVSHNCYARPSHAYLGLSPGIDFETKLFAKPDAAEHLREELAAPSYRVQPIAIGVNTDAYQPIEREHKITRSVLRVLDETAHPAYLITKNALIERDLDLLQSMARRNLVSVTLTIVTLDKELARHLEPRASAPSRRLQAVERLAAAGIPVNVNIAPVIPFLTDSELESLLEASVNAGARSAMYTLLRLPWEVKDIFRAWLEEHYPLKAAHVMSRVHQMRGGKDNDPSFGSRMAGQGLFAELLRQRFDKACARLGLDKRSELQLDCSQFRPPGPKGQGALF
jgi:DNA repair photolyase